MQLAKIISMCDQIRPNAFDPEIKTQWINEVEFKAYDEVLRKAGACFPYRPYDYNADAEQDLFIPDQYSDAYLAYLYAKIDFSNMEIERYNNDTMLANSAFGEYAAWFRRTHKPGAPIDMKRRAVEENELEKYKAQVAAATTAAEAAAKEAREALASVNSISSSVSQTGTAAATAASSASASASSASNSANSATASAGTASQKSASAGQYAQAAAASASSASGYAANASTYATAASGYKDSANTYSQAALAAKAIAEAKADAAGNYATAASRSASAAASSAATAATAAEKLSEFNVNTGALNDSRYPVSDEQTYCDYTTESDIKDLIVDIAKSYYSARGTSSNPTFTYDQKRTPLDPAYDSSKKYMDCSTFVQFVISGTSYSDSPYCGKNLSCNEIWGILPISSGIRTAAGMAKAFNASGCAVDISDGFDNVEIGDIAFFAKGTRDDRYMGISHCTMIASIKSDGTHGMYECTTSKPYIFNRVLEKTYTNSDGSISQSPDQVVLVIRPRYIPKASIDYYTKNEVDEKISTQSAKITELNEDLVNKQDKLTVGKGIAISDEDVISYVEPQYELIGTVTLEEDANIVTFDISEGYSDIYLYSTNVSSDGSGYLIPVVNGTDMQWCSRNVSISVRAFLMHGRLMVFSVTGTSSGNFVSTQVAGNSLGLIKSDKITSLSIKASNSSIHFLSGTKFYLYGVKV